MRSEKSTEIQKKWRRCLDFISHNVAPDSYSTWFTPIVFEGIKKNVAVLRVPSQFFYEYIEEHFIGYLRAAIKREFGEKINIGYNIVTDSINNINATALDNKGAVNIERRPETDGDKTPSRTNCLAALALQ